MKARAVFFDRDGVINNNANHYYVFRPADLELNPDIGQCIHKINEAGYKVIVISNQGGISKGLYDSVDVETVHAEIQRQLQHYNANIDDFFYCPHHDKLEKCLCRKPDTLLIEKAAALHNIDFSTSFLIGDSQRDIEAGERAGIKSFKLEANTSTIKIINQIPDVN